MARYAQSEIDADQQLPHPCETSTPGIREANIEDLIRQSMSPAQSLQESLFDRLETDGILTRWPPQMRYSFILICAAACWAAILWPLTLI